jgi:hypothetical protein
MPIEYRAEIIKLSTEQRQVEINIKLLVLTKTRERNHWAEERANKGYPSSLQQSSMSEVSHTYSAQANPNIFTTRITSQEKHN